MEPTKLRRETRISIAHTATEDGPQTYDMVVFCHLRWQFVYQRPQHIISRMAKEYKVLFIEEPIAFEPGEENSGNLIIINDNLHVLQPRVSNINKIKNIIPQFVSNNHVDFGWFYSAAFVPLLEEFNFNTIVYDCMDELSMFKGAPSELIVLEKFLLSNAHIVFTGGKSLYESKKIHHKNVYCFPSSVDREHFEKAMNGVIVPDDIACISHPVVGYFGVIDERLDLELIREAAETHPDISFAMIGPLAKISEEDLPRLENIHYLGMKSYEILPNYLKAFAIAMMPFALNDATKFISPTKTLEYIAAGKPIISTPIKDVVRDFNHCVTIVENAQEFSDAILFILENHHDLSLEFEYEEILEKTSWNKTVEKMSLLISKTARS